MIKSLLAIMLVFAPLIVCAAPYKLGSEDDPIRQALFANQPVKILLSRAKWEGKAGPFQTFSDASRLADAGHKTEAISLYRSVFQTPGLETRIYLWTWSCLRDVGDRPDTKIAGKVMGAVLEMPTNGAYDTLAAYADGSARYLNFSGRGVFWDLKDAEITQLCAALIDSTIPASGRAKFRPDVSLPTAGAQVTLLTPSGNYAIKDPPNEVVQAGYLLMVALMKHGVKTMANQLTDPTP